jgi:hypothetical protein
MLIWKTENTERAEDLPLGHHVTIDGPDDEDPDDEGGYSVRIQLHEQLLVDAKGHAVALDALEEDDDHVERYATEDGYHLQTVHLELSEGSFLTREAAREAASNLYATGRRAFERMIKSFTTEPGAQ